MVHCTKCGAQVPDDSRFCQNCGQPQPATAAANPTSNPATSSGLSENVAGLLCYVLGPYGWLSGIIFYLIDRRPFVRFHAVQSIVTFGGLTILRIILGAFLGVGWWFGGPMAWTGLGAGAFLLGIISLITLVAWIVCMVRAYQGVRFKLPIVGDIAENAAR